MNFLGFGQSAEVDIVFDGAENRKFAEVKTEDGKKEKYLLYYDGETVSGKVNVTLKKPGSKLEHQGIKIELIGQIELFYDRGNHYEFTSLVRELARPGDLIQNTSYPFEFANVEKPYEVYVGSNVRLRYFLRVTIVRRLSDIIREVDIAVHTLCSYPDMNSPIKMEVGIEDCLHIEFEYNKSKYHLKDVIVGKIYFLLVRIKIKHMEIAIIKRETTGSGANIFTENETIAKYEIMDGAPVKGESIPIRVFLAGYDLTPTMRDISKKFSVKYFLNLVLMDTEDRRYFKQQEITLWRKSDKSRKTQSQSANNPHVPTHLVGGPDNDMSSKHNSTGVAGNIGVSSSSECGAIGTSSPAGYIDNHTTDPRMGLFTRESPPEDNEHQHQHVQTNKTGNSELPLPINSQMQRGRADGASAQTDGLIDENGSLFDTNNTMVSNVSSRVVTSPSPPPAVDAIINSDESTSINQTVISKSSTIPLPAETTEKTNQEVSANQETTDELSKINTNTDNSPVKTSHSPTCD